jgi:SHS2 domain-containing protein
VQWPLLFTGHDLKSLLFAYMEEFLFLYSTDGVCITNAEISDMDLGSYAITVTG